tara:strand:- start:1248 stop:2336 length:1089 start_codon:yes stop_codon:yes gene_type:complete
MGAAGAGGGGNELYAWGRNHVGQFGDGSTTNTSSPVQVGDAGDWAHFSAGFQHAAAIKDDGTLWTWGYNNFGQLGDGSTTNRSSPVQVGSATDWASSSCGSYQNTFAIKTTGALFVWGRNPYGVLMTGNTTNYSSPVQVGALTNWLKTSSQGAGSNAIKTDGTLWGCGILYNTGDGTSRSSPLQIGAATDWVDVSCGKSISLARKSNGTLWAWGQAYFGGLGNGTSTPNVLSPIQVGSLTDWTGVNTAAQGIIASRSNGTLWAWGRGASGRLGLGNTSDVSSPTQIGSLTDWGVSIDNNRGPDGPTQHVKDDGTLWTWGYNNFGELGNGSTTNTSSPIQIGSDTDWVSAHGGSGTTWGIRGE